MWLPTRGPEVRKEAKEALGQADPGLLGKAEGAAPLSSGPGLWLAGGSAKGDRRPSASESGSGGGGSGPSKASGSHSMGDGSLSTVPGSVSMGRSLGDSRVWLGSGPAGGGGPAETEAELGADGGVESREAAPAPSWCRRPAGSEVSRGSPDAERSEPSASSDGAPEGSSAPLLPPRGLRRLVPCVMSEA